MRPVPDAHVDAIRPYVSRQILALVELQRLTAARPGEVVALRRMDVEMRPGPVWVGKPAQHKTAHHGHERLILFGPRAQTVLRPFLSGRSPALPLFGPKEAEEERLRELHEQRVTPLDQGNRPSDEDDRRPLGDAYTVGTYRQAVHRACDRAGIPRWSPGRLRHNAATELRRTYGMEPAQTILGHRLGSAVTEVYAEVNLAKAEEVMGRIG